MSGETELKYPPPKKPKRIQKFHAQTGVKKMEKKLGVFFTTIVTHINNNNNATLSIFSNPNTNIQTAPYTPLLLSLQYVHLCVSIIYSPTHYLLPSIITSAPPFGIFASVGLLFLLRLRLAGVLDTLRGLHTLTRLKIELGRVRLLILE